MRVRSSSQLFLNSPKTSTQRFMHSDRFKFSQAFGPAKLGFAWHSSKKSASEVVKANGLKASGVNTNLDLHVINKPGGIYISYAPSLYYATPFCKPLHYDKDAKYKISLGSELYFTNIPEIHVNVPLSYLGKVLEREGIGQPAFAESEKEIAGVGDMGLKDILANRHYMATPGVGLPFVFTSPITYNHLYQPRNWSITILSASHAQAKSFEDNLRAVGYLKNNERFITLEEAKEAAAALTKSASEYAIDFDSVPVNFKIVPTAFSSSQVIDRILKEYHGQNQKNDVSKKVTTVGMVDSEVKQATKSPWKIASDAQQLAKNGIDVTERVSTLSNALFNQKAIAPKETKKVEQLEAPTYKK